MEALAEFCSTNTKSKTCTPVILYTTPGCGYCAQGRGLLKGLRVPFREVPVTNQVTAAQLVKLTGQTGAPVLVVGKKVVVGYSEKDFRRALKIKKR